MVIGICSRRVVGWSIADHMRTYLVTDAVETAVAAGGGDVTEVVFHTDRGTRLGFNHCGASVNDKQSATRHPDTDDHSDHR
jgi:transposase InsO family protein